MSVEKLCNLSVSHIEQNPYGQILNKISEHIKDNDAYRLYGYLSSKSREWKVIKEWTAEKCGISEKKAKKCWSYLFRCGLIKYIVVKDEKGKIIKHDTLITNGLNFDQNEPFLCGQPTGAKTTPVDKVEKIYKSPLGSVSTRVGFAPLLKKDLNKKKINKKSFCKTKEQKETNSKRHDWASSKDAMANEKKHIDENNKIKRTPMPDELRNKYQNLIKTKTNVKIENNTRKTKLASSVFT